MTKQDKERIADYFTPAELIELLDIDTAELISILDEETGLFDEEVLEEIDEIMGVDDD